MNLYVGSMEEWRDIEDYEGQYMISNEGRVKNLKTGHIRKGKCNKKGYEQVMLGSEGLYWNYLVHRLVAKAFIPNPENKPTVDHIKSKEIRNNCIDNLRWATYKEQIANRILKNRNQGGVNLELGS
jgi:hypothetical protein